MSEPYESTGGHNDFMTAPREAEKEWLSEWYLTPSADTDIARIIVERGCACNRQITLSELSAVMSGLAGNKGLFSRSSYSSVRGASLEIFLSCLNTALAAYGIDTCIDKAHFLAHVAVESDELRTTEEYRNRDGSTPKHWHRYSGGETFHGRGLIQLTHDYNYRKYSNQTGKDYLKDPELVAVDLSTSTDSACWYWRKGSAWGDMSARSKQNDFPYTTIGVNGGFMHFERRISFLQSLAKSFQIERCEHYSTFRFEQFTLAGSQLSKTKSGPKVWRRFFGEDDEI
jgi:predicted chitinase